MAHFLQKLGQLVPPLLQFCMPISTNTKVALPVEYPQPLRRTPYQMGKYQSDGAILNMAGGFF